MNLLLKLLGTGATVGAGFIGGKLVNVVWHKSTGNEPPKANDDLENSLRSVLAFALISAAVNAIIQVIVGRSTQHAIVKFHKTPDEV